MSTRVVSLFSSDVGTRWLATASDSAGKGGRIVNTHVMRRVGELRALLLL